MNVPQATVGFREAQFPFKLIPIAAGRSVNPDHVSSAQLTWIKGTVPPKSNRMQIEISLLSGTTITIADHDPSVNFLALAKQFQIELPPT